MPGHKSNASTSQNQKAQLANAYNELGKELSSTKIRVVGNYTLGKVIGEGAYGKVRMGTHRLTSTRVAIKQIPKEVSASLTREIHHHRQLHHPHIAQMYEVIATESSIWIVTELCCGGELFDYLVEKGRIAEDDARIIFGQLCLAVAYLHENGIVHRDLKLENVLLDEHCRVKLGDFGFTREYDRSSLMETYCGTTGYAAPEMLQGKKYQGPEVDVWSLGVILYCLLTGTLPFDDDDEDVMREKIIQGDFEDPVWLSTESRDLLKTILQKDVTKRIQIPGILSHPWFTSPKLTFESSPPASPIHQFDPVRASTPDEESRRTSESTGPDSSVSSTQDSFSPSTDKRDLHTSTPTTPDESLTDPFESTQNPACLVPRLSSNSTLRNPPTDLDSVSIKLSQSGDQPETVPEESESATPMNLSKCPPAYPLRTPARTKRRSTSSFLSDPGSPSTERLPTPLPIPPTHEIDFSSLLSAPTPIIFSTPVERRLLNTLSMLGFDTAQIVHSVLTNACDAAGAVWWMIRKKEEQQMNLSSDDQDSSLIAVSPIDVETASIDRESSGLETTHKTTSKRKKSKRPGHSVSTQTEPTDNIQVINMPIPPQFSFIPATPTFIRPTTPPRNVSPTKSPLLSPSTSSITAETSGRSHPPTPGGSLKDKERERDRDKKPKPRSGSVSIMQRATTALEAAGLVRKRSAEAVREERERDKEKERERERSRENDRRVPSGDEPRSSHGSSSSKLTKSPPLRPTSGVAPSTPPPNEASFNHSAINASPWVLADPVPSASSTSSLNARAEITHSQSMPNVLETPKATDASVSGGRATKPPAQAHRNKANLLQAFRLWFNEERKGKRKEAQNPPAATNPPYGRPASRRGSSSGTMSRGTHRAQRPSISSRRSSSVNSHRSSTSNHMALVDSPQPAVQAPMVGRKSFGSHTPNSERDHSSRPSSIRSVSMQPRHRKSPSQSSAGSVRTRATSPMKIHRRVGSSSSATRVVRQGHRIHGRSNSATSSIHSPPSSRPTSFYEASDAEPGVFNLRTASPFKSRSRRSGGDETPSRKAMGTFVQKRQGPFINPSSAGLGRSSWKKSWGLEPPGWSSRTTHLPIEVLSMSPPDGHNIRDVFSSKGNGGTAGGSSWAAGDESDWVDEDDDLPVFAGGLGQPTKPSTTTSLSSLPTVPDIPGGGLITLSPAPRHRTAVAATGKRSTARNTALASSASSTSSTSGGPSGTGGASWSKPGASPVERPSPLPPLESYDSMSRRQLPNSRSGYGFKHPIQEEDEEEEEE